MSLHPSLVPLTGISPAYGWDVAEELGSGGFASVRALGPAEVIKLSCCPASNDWMACARRKPSRWPAAFPTVYEHLGPQGIDADGMQFHGWRIERLFAFEDVAAAIRARSVTIGKRMAKDPALATKAVQPNVDAYAALQAAAQACQLDPEAHWTKDACAALLMASTCDEDLREGFLSLFHFIEAHQVRLDVAHAANLMMDCFGRIRLADPLSMRLDIDESAEPFSRHWVGARMPVVQTGLKVTTLWRVVPVASEDAAREVRKQLLMKCGSALETRTVHRPRDVASLLAQPLAIEPVFPYGKRLNALLAGDASDLLFGALDMA